MNKPREEELTTSIAGYRRPYFATQPEYLYPGYRSTVKRAPTRPLVLLPHTLSEVTGPVFGYDDVNPTDSDLTRQHDGEPIGERIVVSGRLLDENGLCRRRRDVDPEDEAHGQLPAVVSAAARSALQIAWLTTFSRSS